MCCNKADWVHALGPLLFFLFFGWLPLSLKVCVVCFQFVGLEFAHLGPMQQDYFAL